MGHVRRFLASSLRVKSIYLQTSLTVSFFAFFSANSNTFYSKTHSKLMQLRKRTPVSSDHCDAPSTSNLCLYTISPLSNNSFEYESDLNHATISCVLREFNVMQVSISSITIPFHTPPGICSKNFPHRGVLNPAFSQRARIF